MSGKKDYQSKGGLWGIGDTCGEIYTNKLKDIDTAYSGLDNAFNNYKNKFTTDPPEAKKALQLYYIIRRVGTDGKYAPSKDCKAAANELGGKVFENFSTLSYSGLISDFIEEAKRATSTIQKVTLLSTDTNTENAKVIEFLNKIGELQTDLLRTVGIDGSIKQFLTEQLGMDTKTLYGLYTEFTNIIESSKKNNNNMTNVISRIFELFQRYGFTQTQYRCFINILSRLYIAVSRKKFVLSHKFGYYYSNDSSVTPPHGGKKKKSGGDLPTALEGEKFNCGDQETIIKKIADKTQSIDKHLANMNSIMKLVEQYKPSLNLLSWDFVSNLISRKPNATKYQKIGIFYIVKQIELNLAPNPQIILNGDGSGVYIYDNRSYTNKAKIFDFVNDCQLAINNFIAVFLDDKDKGLSENNKKVRMDILGLIADLIEFFQFKISCTSKRGGGSKNTVEMISNDGTKYSVSKSQVKYFEGLGFKLHGGNREEYLQGYVQQGQPYQGQYPPQYQRQQVVMVQQQPSSSSDTNCQACGNCCICLGTICCLCLIY
jgi:hypothetical protein